jgi:hypothetical protein
MDTHSYFTQGYCALPCFCLLYATHTLVQLLASLHVRRTCFSRQPDLDLVAVVIAYRTLYFVFSIDKHRDERLSSYERRSGTITS